MTGLTIRPKSQDVILGEYLINFQMAGCTSHLIERSAITIDMAVSTFKRSTVHSQTVRF